MKAAAGEKYFINRGGGTGGQLCTHGPCVSPCRRQRRMRPGVHAQHEYYSVGRDWRRRKRRPAVHARREYCGVGRGWCWRKRRPSVEAAKCARTARVLSCWRCWRRRKRRPGVHAQHKYSGVGGAGAGGRGGQVHARRWFICRTRLPHQEV